VGRDRRHHRRPPLPRHRPWDFYSKDPLTILKVNEGGLAIYGTIVGGPVAGAVYAWRKGLNVARLADIAAPPLILGMAIGRIGDVINGEHHGAHAQGFPLAFVYTNPNTLGELGVPVHLAVGYEMVMDLLIFVGLVWLARGVVRRRDGSWRFGWQPRYPRDGMLFWIYLCVYSLGRFFIQFYRVDTPFALGLSQAQLLSVLTAMVAVWMLVYQMQRAKKRGPSVRAYESDAISIDEDEDDEDEDPALVEPPPTSAESIAHS